MRPLQGNDQQHRDNEVRETQRMLGNAVYASNQSLFPGLHDQDACIQQRAVEEDILWGVREGEEKVKQNVIIIYFYHCRLNEDQSKSFSKANNILFLSSANRDN